MPKIVALDFGIKRSGLAETDELQIIASGLTTVNTAVLMDFLKEYFKNNQVEIFVVGKPVRMHGEASAVENNIIEFIKAFQKQFPHIKIEREEEWFTSKLAVRAMVDGGMKKKDRRVKGNVDRVSATIILQSFLERNRAF